MQKYPLTILLLIFTLLSCKKDEELPNPQLDFQIKTTGNITVMHQKETIIASFEDEKDIKTVFFTVDGKKIAEDNEAPYEVEWNTLEESDGAHTLIVTAINTAGKPFESSLDVHVSNTFVTVEAVPGYLTGETRKVWYYISDLEGNVITGLMELKEGQVQKALRPEGFTSEKYNFNLVEVTEYAGGFKVLYVDTYTGLTPGKYFTHGYTPQQDATPIDEFRVTIDRNTTDPENIFILSNLGVRRGNYSVTQPASLIHHKVSDENESNRYYLTYQPEVGLDYAFYQKLEHSPDTEEYHFDAVDFTPMDKNNLSLNITPTSKSAAISGIDGSDRYYIYQGSSNDISKAIPYYTIDADFEEYIYSFSYSSGNETWSVYGKGHPSDGQFMDNTVQAAFASGNTLTVESIAGVDYIRADKFFSGTDFSFQHNYYGANDGKPVIFTDIPEVLAEKYPEISASREEEKEMEVFLTDFNNLNSYDKWLDSRFSKEVPDYWDYYGGYTSISKKLGTTATSGRKKTNPSAKVTEKASHNESFLSGR